MVFLYRKHEFWKAHFDFLGYGISGDLKEYLAGRFEEDDVDSELQKTIRDNLYERTVPCKILNLNPSIIMLLRK